MHPVKIFIESAINLLTEEINSVLGMERTKVMSMEDMEAIYLNGMLSGVSFEVENARSLVQHRFIYQRRIH